ncbi:nitrate/nitrite transporter NrtS [Afipia sp. 1NLS2]|uniref:nitrate/nitrite transporter NrtS n=1 Tax=Afipia sp. 1NLS2 TaxID=666684 RepID=UPI0005907C70|nr:nitrate/nitrite transporter NrtS [Afipia sp. 1NLS2]
MTGQRPTPRLFAICQCCVSDGVPRRSFIVALIVGTILNLINQGDALFGDGRVNWAKIILTFAVPYCVATYGAVSYRLTAPRSAR